MEISIALRLDIETVKILVNTTNLNNPGGVANYYRVLDPFLSPYADYHQIGGRVGDKGLVKNVVRLFGDYVGFIRKIRLTPYDCVVLNPSLGKKSLLRDSIFAMLCLLLKKKFVIFFRGWDEEFESKNKLLVKSLFKYVLFNATGVIVLGEAFKEKLLSYGYEGKILKETTVADIKYDNEKDVLSWKEKDTIEILYIGRLVKEKGVLIAIDVVVELTKKFPNIVMNIAGDGKDFILAQEYIEKKQAKNVFMVGDVRGVGKEGLLKSADVLLFPTEYGEGLPNCIVEGMAYGLVVCSTNVGGIPDLVEKTKTGKVVTLNRAEEYVEFLEKLLSNKKMIRESQRENCSYGIRHLSAKAVAGRYIKNIERFLRD
ncbi:MAG: glycosyltransferase family 4 protein [Gammaproteobacteria bacterium]|nr:glycosyltransferase family 4 protein [Gammaproteobacteria bacterium]